MIPVKHKIRNCMIVLSGHFVMAFGIVMMVKAGLGVNPWNVFHTGIANHTPLTLGQANQVTSVFLILFGLMLGIRPGLGTFMTMYFPGFFIDLIMEWPWLFTPSSLAGRCAYLVLGTLLFGIGSGSYLNADLGAGPRDSMMLGLSRRTKKSVRFMRTSLEVAALTAGIVLGGQAGVGTVFYALVIGPVLQWSLRLSKPIIQLRHSEN